MNRRTFFKTVTSFVALFGISPALLAQVKPVEPVFHSKEWWKRYFRENTFESKYDPPPANSSVKEHFEYHRRQSERFHKDSYVQMDGNLHTDKQIDALPNGKGVHLIFRFQYTHYKGDGIPTIDISICKTPIELV